MFYVVESVMFSVMEPVVFYVVEPVVFYVRLTKTPRRLQIAGILIDKSFCETKIKRANK